MVNSTTKCEQGNKKKEIQRNTKKVMQKKMEMRKHLTQLKKNLGYHVLRCVRMCNKNGKLV